MATNRGIMQVDAGFAGQTGYVVRKGQEVLVQPATNLPAGTGIAYFVLPGDFAEVEDCDGPAIGVGPDDVKLIVDYNDIETGYEYDEYHDETPWDSCDGWEHEFEPQGYDDHEDRREAYNYVCRDRRDGGSGWIVIDDSTVIGWGHERRNGESVQVWRERVARVKRDAVKQLVEWYQNGWHWYTAYAKFEDEEAGIDEAEYLGGIDDADYAEECARDELADQLAYRLESEGYIVINKPADSADEAAREATYLRNRRAEKIRQIRYNLTGVWK